LKVYGETLRELTTDELNALRKYASIHGRNWKSALRDQWERASAIGPLHALRNSHGPTWLVRFRLPKA